MSLSNQQITVETWQKMARINIFQYKANIKAKVGTLVEKQ